MSIEVTFRHMDVKEQIQAYAREQAGELAGEFPRVEHVHVILNYEKHEKSRMIAHVVVQARNHIRVEAEEESDNMRTALDEAMEKVERQLRRLRDKVQDHKPAMKHGEALRNGLPTEPA